MEGEPVALAIKVIAINNAGKQMSFFI